MLNRQRVIDYICTPSDAPLYRLLTRYGASIGTKLIWLLDYFDNYNLQPSYHRTRGYEMACALDVMVAHAGGCKRTWSRTINTLCMLGLLNRYRPKIDARDNHQNTPAQDYSVSRIDDDRRHPVTWYSVPEYTEAVWAQANELAPIALKYTSGLDKDSIRYELGAREANRIFDTGYPKAPWRARMEQALWQTIQEHINARGYTTLPDVLDAVCGRTGRDEKALLLTWKSYRHQLADEHGVCYQRPTADQKAAFHLEGDKWIISKQK